MNSTEDTKVMSKQEAIAEVKKVFKGHKKFISYCEVLIASTDHFVGIDSHCIEFNNWNWEKFMRLTINTKQGFKQICYRKGNKKYAPENCRTIKGNTTSNIHEYLIFTYFNGENDEYIWDA